jgi:hypothetical protein
MKNTNNKEQIADSNGAQIRMKETALDQILNSINKCGLEVGGEYLNKLKETEKNQMVDFAIKCMFNSDDIGSNLRNHFIQKYNETYGGNK